MMMAPRFSIIIPTYGRASEISALLSDLSKQTCMDFEVIIVDDTPNDSVRVVAEQFSFVRYYHPSERLGMVKSRNFGASVAKGEYLVFMDSDVRVSPQFVESLARAIGFQSLDGGVCNIYDHGRKHRVLSALFRAIFPLYFLRFVPTLRCGTCAVFRKDAFVAVGGFLEDLVGYTYLEDLELVWRFVDSGFSFGQLDGVCIDHLNSNNGTRPDELFYRIVNMYVIFKRHFPRPPLRERVLFVWYSIGIVVKNIILAFLNDRSALRGHILSIKKILCWLRNGLPVREAEINNVLMRCGI